MKKLHLFLFLLFSFNAFSQQKFQRWYGNPGGFDGAGAVPAKDGGYFIIGEADQGSYPPYNPRGYITKADSLLNPVWTKTFEKLNYSNSISVVLENSDGAYFINVFFDSASTSYHNCMIKTNSNGDTLWCKQGWIPNTMYATSDGGYILHGGGQIMKTDSSLNIIWQKDISGGGSDRMQPTNDGGYVMLGSSDFSTSQYGECLSVTKIDSVGSVQWSMRYGTTTEWERGPYGKIPIAQTVDGGYIFIGSTGQTLSGGDYDVLVVKTDSSGNVQWAKTYGGTGEDCGVSIRPVGGAIGYIFTARTYGVESPQNSMRTMMVRIDGNGNILWGKMYGRVALNQHNADDVADGVEPTPDGGFLFTGGAQETGTYDWNGWVVKTDANGVSGCNEVGTYPTIAIPNLLVLPQVVKDSSVVPVQFTSCSPFFNNPWQLPDSILCPIPVNPGVNEFDLDKLITLFPNPTNGKVNVQISKFSDVQMKGIEIYNIMGEEIQKLAVGSMRSANNSPVTIDLSAEPDGIYFVRIFSDVGIISKKIIVSK